MEKKKVGFASGIGFILAAAGSAVGLGNLWGFPYKTSQNGGAAFVLIYVACVLLIGFVTMLSEIYLGRRAQANPMTAYKMIHKNLGWCGLVAIVIPAFIICYYSVLGGWTTKYALNSFSGNAGIVGTFSVNTGEVILYTAIFLVLSMMIIMGGVKDGIEKASKVLMPVLFLILVAIAVYALPYVAAGLLSPVQAVFESTSGLTTTGLSVVDVDTCPAIFLFHRSLTCYLGGVGLVLILTCVVTQTGGLGVYNAEGHTDHLLPSAAKTARMILLIYNGLIIAGAVAYWAAGMTPFDAINISMCAVPTGGFATHGESIAYWNSPVIEAITIVLMVAGGTNFLLLFLLLRGKLKAFLTHIETPLYFGTIAVMALVVAGFFLGQGVSGDGAEALRQGTFQVVSILTSTGFQTIPSFADLGPALLFLFGLLMLVGAEARSTSGGIKLYRVAVASLGLGRDLHERYGNKRHVTSIKINRFGKRSVLTEVDVAEAQTYVVLYLLLCAAGAFALILCGATLQEAVFDFISCLGSTGVGTGFLGTESGPAPLLIGSAGMLLGRLEIIPLFMGVGTMASMIRKGVRHGR